MDRKEDYAPQRALRQCPAGLGGRAHQDGSRVPSSAFAPRASQHPHTMCNLYGSVDRQTLRARFFADAERIMRDYGVKVVFVDKKQ